MSMDWKQSIYSDGSKEYVSNPNPKLGEVVEISVRLFKDAPVEGVFLRYLPNGEHEIFKMYLKKEDEIFAYYSYDLRINEPLINYRFMFATEEDTYYYNQLELTNYDPNEHYDFRILADYENPTWVKGSVFYQIFPERFCNGNPDNDVKDGEYSVDGHPTIARQWGEIPMEYHEAYCLDFYGGDLEGIKKQIPHFKKLGVNALYLNPIFKAPSHHKYDCIDYFEVDPHFGGNKALQELVEELHKNDMRIMLDTSVNHTGTGHKWFNKEGYFEQHIGAYHNPEALEREYYYFDENGDYHKWLGVETLPSMDYRSQKLRETIYKREESVLQYWLRPPYNIDAWRLDVANNLGRKDEVQMADEVWPELRASLKGVNPEMYLIGEHWADTEKYLRGNAWDAAMNYYGFLRPVREFVGDQDVYLRPHVHAFKSKKKDAEKLSKQLVQHVAHLPFQFALNQFNILDSHDIYRLHISPGVSFEGYRGAVMMLFTFIGTPSMYYGDEVGLAGDLRNLEGCRYTMEWDEEKWNKDFYSLYSTLAHLRQKEEVLQEGGFKVLFAESGIIAYVRFNSKKAFITVVSQENEDREISIPVKHIGILPSSKIKEIFSQKDVDFNEQGEIVVNIEKEKAYLFEIQL